MTIFLVYSKFKGLADDRMIMTQKLEFVLGRVENIVGKGENAGYQHFLLFPQYFLKLSFPEVLKVLIVKKTDKPITHFHARNMTKLITPS